MPRRTTKLVRGYCYHVYNRGHDRSQLFQTDRHYAHFVTLLRRYLHDAGDSIHAYCLMPNHFHLMLRPWSDDCPGRLGRMQMAFSKAVQRETARTGSAYEGRYQAIEVNTEAYGLSLSRYIHRNAYEAGLCRAVTDWKWSSYPDYVGPRFGTLPDTRWLAAESTPGRYRRFVEADSAPRLPADLRLD